MDCEGVKIWSVAAGKKAEYRDDLTGQPLDPAMVQAARRKELEYFKKMRVYEKRPVSECYATTGKVPIKIRWVDTNKSNDE